MVRRAAEAGRDPAEPDKVLGSDTYAAEVRAEEQEARELGINGVPFFVVDRRYGVSGAQPAAVLLQVLDRAWAETHPTPLLPPAGGGPRHPPSTDQAATSSTPLPPC